MSLRGKKKGDPPPEVVLPITPMLDMSFQLLAFFIMVYHPAAKEGQEEIVLPTAEERANRAAQRPEDVDPRNKPRPNAKTPEKKDDDLVVLMEDYIAPFWVKKDGQKVLDNRKTFKLRLQVNDRPVMEFDKGVDDDGNPGKADLKQLVKELQDRFKRQSEIVADKYKAEEDPDKQKEKIKKDMDNFPVRIVPSPQIDWGEVVAIRDLCRSAGFRRVVCGDPLVPRQ
jgi:biopolymer transport protein ExbD